MIYDNPNGGYYSRDNSIPFVLTHFNFNKFVVFSNLENLVEFQGSSIRSLMHFEMNKIE